MQFSSQKEEDSNKIMSSNVGEKKTVIVIKFIGQSNSVFMRSGQKETK